MILSDTLNQPRALFTYAALGVIMGIIYAINSFTCVFLIKKHLYRHISQCLYVLLYGLIFFLTTFSQFDYDLKIYHVIISLFFTALTAYGFSLLLRKYNKPISVKCNSLKARLAQSRAVKKLKK